MDPRRDIPSTRSAPALAPAKRRRPRRACTYGEPSPYRASSEPLPDLSPDQDDVPPLLYCHLLTLPLFTRCRPSDPYLLKICIHPDWLMIPDGVVHLSRDAATISRTSLHSPPLVNIDYEPVDLWKGHVERSTPGLRDSPRLPLRVSSIRESPKNPPGTTGARRPPPPTAPPGAGLVFAIIALVAIISAFLPGGHPGWVSTSSTDQTADFNIWQPVHLLYRDYQDVLVPLLTPFELDESVPLPRHLPSMMTAFHEELWEINLRLTSWKGSGLPGHGTALADRLKVCYTELLSIGDSITDFNREGRLLVGSSSPLLLAVALDQANSSQEIAEKVKIFWSTTEERNGKTLMALNRMHRSLAKVRTELEPILDQIEKDLPASQDLWALDLLDAVQFARQHYNEYILRIIPKLISRAIATLSATDSTAAAQLQFWDLMQHEKGVDQRLICRFTTDSPKWHSSWAVQFRSATTRYAMDNKTVPELFKVAETSHMMEVMIRQGLNPQKQFREFRPRRPSQM